MTSGRQKNAFLSTQAVCHFNTSTMKVSQVSLICWMHKTSAHVDKSYTSLAQFVSNLNDCGPSKVKFCAPIL